MKLKVNKFIVYQLVLVTALFIGFHSVQARAATLPTTFTGNDPYITITQADSPVVISSPNGDVQVGALEANTEFRIYSETTSFVKIQFGSGYAYVRKSYGVPSDGSTLTNVSSTGTSSLTFNTTQTTAVYDQTGKTVIAKIESGQTYPVVQVASSGLYEIAIGGRPGYVQPTDVHSTQISQTFTGAEKYIEITQDHSPVVINSSNGDVQVGELEANSVYRILSESGNFVRIQFNNSFGYVRMSYGMPSDGATLSNEPSTGSNQFTFNTTQTTSIYDSNGALIGKLLGGLTYPVIQVTASGDYQILIGGRTGIVHSSDVQLVYKTYFKPIVSGQPIYINDNGNNVFVGSLQKGQDYQILSQIDNFFRIQYGTSFAYVRKSGTVPSSGASVKNANSTYTNSDRFIRSKYTIDVYDNTSGSLVSFATLRPGVVYPVVSQTSPNWYRILFGGRVGYIYKPRVDVLVNNSDAYFKTPTPVDLYKIANGTPVKIGLLQANQEFPITQQTDSFIGMQYGDSVAYVNKLDVVASDGATIQNSNSQNLSATRSVQARYTMPIYDNTSGKLVEMGELNPGQPYKIIKATSAYWDEAVFGNRIGYIYRPRSQDVFQSTDQYIQTLDQGAPIYLNNNGVNVQVGTLAKNQIFPVTGQMGTFFKVNYGQYTGYVQKSNVYYSDGSTAQGLDSGSTFSTTEIKTVQQTNVYTGMSTSQPVFMTLEPNQFYPMIKQVSSDWILTSVSGRLGYIQKSDVEMGPIVDTTSYNETLSDVVSIETQETPVTDKNYDAYIISSAFNVNPTTNPTSATVVGTYWNVHGGPSTSAWVLGQLNDGDTVKILSQSKDSSGKIWYKINYNVQWETPSLADLTYYIDPTNFKQDSASFFQFLKLTGTIGLTADTVNASILYDKGNFVGKGQAFIDGAKQNNINEIYLISHAMLETGKGTDPLSNGVLVSSINGLAVPPKVVYNMYGIHAYSSCASPVRCAAEYAYSQGWFTPEAAITGGAKFVADDYINSGQDTLYKMRWNPASPGYPQYATDIGWAYKQAYYINSFYQLLKVPYSLQFDVPVYK